MASKTPQLRFDAARFRSVLQTGLMAALEEFEEILIEEMRRQIDRNGNHSGKDEWREAVKNDLRGLSASIAGETIQRIVGLPYSGSDSDYKSMRAFVIAYGTGYNAKGGGEPMKTKPRQEVWDSELVGQHISTARAEWLLPDSWNRPPTDFIDVAVRNLRTEYIRFIETRKDAIISDAIRQSMRFEEG